MFNDMEPFQFELNKNVTFARDYGILDMRKISLDPDITITPIDDYININGLIKLQGEYERSEEDNILEETLTENRQYESMLVNELNDLDDKIVKFNHAFPIDISVPSHRVTNLNDVSVMIESFDYDLISPVELNVKSTLEIEGITMIPVRTAEQVDKELDDEGEQVSAERVTEESQPESEAVQVDEQESKEIKTDEEPERVVEEAIEKISVKETITDDEPAHKEHVRHEEEVVTEVVEQNTIAQDVDEVAENETIENKVAEQDENEARESEVSETNAQSTSEEDVIEEDIDEEEAHEREQDEIDIQMQETKEEEEDHVKDVHFLTTIFDRASEERTTTLRIYIVQEGDSVQTVAKDYDMSALRLVQLNDLTHDDLTPGQLLYIPRQTKAKK